MTECKLTREFCRLLERQGALTYPLIGGKLVPPGWPDRLIAYNGLFTCEMKVGKGWLRPLQQDVCRHLLQRGVDVYVVDLYEDTLSVRTVEGDTLHSLIPWNRFLRVTR